MYDWTWLIWLLAFSFNVYVTQAADEERRKCEGGMKCEEKQKQERKEMNEAQKKKTENHKKMNESHLYFF